MQIEYLKQLRDYFPEGPWTLDGPHTRQGISIAEIEQLETTWNSGSPFPKALRELLYLAGDLCSVVDYSYSDTQQEFQQMMRDIMAEEGHVTITRPFYIVDAINFGTSIMIVYLDEGKEDPTIYQVYPWGGGGYNDIPSNHIKNMHYPLSLLINRGIQFLKEFGSPY